MTRREKFTSWNVRIKPGLCSDYNIWVFNFHCYCYGHCCCVCLCHSQSHCFFIANVIVTITTPVTVSVSDTVTVLVTISVSVIVSFTFWSKLEARVHERPTSLLQASKHVVFSSTVTKSIILRRTLCNNVTIILYNKEIYVIPLVKKKKTVPVIMKILFPNNGNGSRWKIH